MKSYSNPVLSGFYPDPSVCRVGEDYYLATSSFEYFPGVPIFHSTDLIHWEQIGHALTRLHQLDLRHTKSSLGIFAPTFRYHNGVFYLITTDVKGAGHFYVTATHPAGPYSDPIYVKGPGFDPDLFFDDDGAVYFSREDFTGHGIRQWNIDIASGTLLGEERLIWEGLEDRLCEAPHIYKIDQYYYLMVAEGGTHRGHFVAIGRGKHPWGPFESAPHNPILTHRNHVMHPIQATGHADLIQKSDGSWWILFLGIRQIRGMYHHLGRETFLAPVQWVDGWPVVNEGEPIACTMPYYGQSTRSYTQSKTIVETDFSRRLPYDWNFRGNPDPTYIMLGTEEEPSLRLKPSKGGLGKTTGCSFVGRRQKHFSMRFTCDLNWKSTTEKERAGIAVIMNEQHYYAIEISSDMITVAVRLGSLCVRGVDAGCKELPLSESSSYRLMIKSDRFWYYLGVLDQSGKEIILGSFECRFLSSEVAGGFTGVYMGPYAATDTDEEGSIVHVVRSTYEELPEGVDV